MLFFVFVRIVISTVLFCPTFGGLAIGLKAQQEIFYIYYMVLIAIRNEFISVTLTPDCSLLKNFWILP